MEMIYPMFALVLLKFGVGLSLGISRVLSVKRRQVDPRYYRLFCGSPPPEHVLQLLGAAGSHPAIAHRIANGFNNPPDYAEFFMTPDKAAAYLAQVAQVAQMPQAA